MVFLSKTEEAKEGWRKVCETHEVIFEHIFFFTVVPCLLILSNFFIYQLMHKRIAALLCISW